MTKATRTPTAEEYMGYVHAEDPKGMETFLHECFGTHDDYDDDKAQQFAEEVLPLIEQEIKTMMDNVTEAPVEVTDAMEAPSKTSDILTAVKEDTEAVKAAVEATAPSETTEA